MRDLHCLSSQDSLASTTLVWGRRRAWRCCISSAESCIKSCQETRSHSGYQSNVSPLVDYTAEWLHILTGCVVTWCLIQHVLEYFISTLRASPKFFCAVSPATFMSLSAALLLNSLFLPPAVQLTGLTPTHRSSSTDQKDSSLSCLTEDGETCFRHNMDSSPC